MMHTLLVQGAVDTELDRILAGLPAGREAEHNGCWFYETTCGPLRVVLSRTGVGTLNAVLATCAGLSAYRPDAVLNQGSAGGHTRDMAVGDLVLGQSAIPINELTMPIRAAGQGSDALTWQPGPRAVPLKGDAQLLALVRSVPYAGGRVHVGRLGTGDLFSRESDRIDWLHKTFGNLCEDMESAAVYKACHAAGVPVLGVRVIANNELTGMHDAPDCGFFERAKDMLQDHMLNVIRALAQTAPQPQFLPLTDETCPDAARYIQDRWGGVDMVICGKMVNVSAGEGMLVYLGGALCAVCCYAVDGDLAQITLLDSSVENRGIGSALIERVRAIAAARGCRALRLITTNDNLRAIGFYQKRGFVLTRVNVDALEQSRKLKPGIPLVGEHGIPLLHEIEFSMAL